MNDQQEKAMNKEANKIRNLNLKERRTVWNRMKKLDSHKTGLLRMVPTSQKQLNVEEEVSY